MTYKTRVLLVALSITSTGVLVWSGYSTKWAVTPPAMGRHVEMGIYRMCMYQETDPKEMCNRMDPETVQPYWFAVQCSVALSVLLSLINIAGTVILIVKTTIKTCYLSISSGIPGLIMIVVLGVWKAKTSGKANVKIDYGFLLACVAVVIYVVMVIVSFLYYWRLQRQIVKTKSDDDEEDLSEDVDLTGADW